MATERHHAHVDVREEDPPEHGSNSGDATAIVSTSPSRSQPPSAGSKQRAVYGFSFSRVNVIVAGVLLVFAFLFFVDVFLIIVPWLSYSVPGVTNLGVLLITTGMSLYCYLFCVLLDPGSVPPTWHPDEEQQTVMEVKRKDGGVRFCQKCQRYKPPRAHHCRVCGRCVLRMDHHCPWTNNCIGHANYRAFIIFLIHVTAAALHTVGLICAHVLHAIQVSQEQRIMRTGPKGDPIHLQGGWLSSVWVYVAMQTLAFAISLPLSVGLLMLLGWHMHLLAVNKTTIEYKEGVRSSLHTFSYEHPYDVGLCGNLHESLGDSPLEWCLPPCGPAQGGTKYLTIFEQRALGL